MPMVSRLRPDELSAGLNVLLVEDHAATAAGLALSLRRSGHEVEIAPDGPTAVEAAKTRQPDVVLLDIGLPGMDGYEVARRLGGQPTVKAPLLIALTGRGGESDPQRSE